MYQFFRKMQSYLGNVNKAHSDAARRQHSFRPKIEALEARLVPTISYNGGSVLDHVSISAVYYGHAWNVDPAMQQERQQMDAFLKDIVSSPYMDAMSEYYMNDPHYGQLRVGRGSFAKSEVVDAVFRTDSSGKQVVDDQAIQKMLQQEIQNTRLQGGVNTLTMVFTPQNVVLVSNGGNSANYLKELGHHTSYVDPWVANSAYAVMPNPIGNPNGYWAATSTDVQKLTGVASHELQEAVTDPYPGSGWYDNSPPIPGITENGDYTVYYKPYAGLNQKGSPGNFGPDQQYSLLNGYVVQNVWSAKSNNTIALPQTPADLVGATFTFQASYSAKAIVGTLYIRAENTTTGSFTGSYLSFFGWVPVSGQITSTASTGGTLKSSISFSGAAYLGSLLENVSYQGQVTGNGRGASSWSDTLDGTLLDLVYNVPNSYALIYIYASASHATDW